MSDRNRARLPSQNPAINNLYSRSQPPLPQRIEPPSQYSGVNSSQSPIPRSRRAVPRTYTATSYIGPPGTYCHGQRPPPRQFEPDQLRAEKTINTQLKGGMLIKKSIDTDDQPSQTNITPEKPTNIQLRAGMPTQERMDMDERLLRAKTIPGNTITTQLRAGMLTKSIDTDNRLLQPQIILGDTIHTQPKTAYTSRPHNPWDRCVELNCTKRGLHYHHLDETPPPQNHKNKRKREIEIYSESESSDDDYRDVRRRRAVKRNRAGHAATWKRPKEEGGIAGVRDALPVPRTRQEAESQGREMTLALRPARERWASTPTQKRRVDAENANPPPALPLRPAQPPAPKEKSRINTKPSNPTQALSLRPKEQKTKNKPSTPEETALSLRPAKKRRLVAAKDSSEEGESIAERVLRRRKERGG
ncbi:MAG: hypothetical protein Q9195_006468 [Heterodermia aff. obscurata]